MLATANKAAVCAARPARFSSASKAALSRPNAGLSAKPQGLNRSAARFDVKARGYPAYQEEPVEEPKRYPDPEFIEETLAAFPDDGVADVEQARVLYAEEGGYTFLDVRSKAEYDDDGKVPNAVNIPLIHTQRKWNLSVTPAEMEIIQEANVSFLDEIKAKFPDKESKLLIACSDGTQRAIQVLMLLDAEGYTNIVGLKGGFIAWNAVFTTKLERRGLNVKYETVYTADGDGMGIHSTGAGFSSVDKVDFHIGSVDYEKWIKWSEVVNA